MTPVSLWVDACMMHCFSTNFFHGNEELYLLYWWVHNIASFFYRLPTFASFSYFLHSFATCAIILHHQHFTFSSPAQTNTTSLYPLLLVLAMYAAWFSLLRILNLTYPCKRIALSSLEARGDLLWWVMAMVSVEIMMSYFRSTLHIHPTMRSSLSIFSPTIVLQLCPWSF